MVFPGRVRVLCERCLMRESVLNRDITFKIFTSIFNKKNLEIYRQLNFLIVSHVAYIAHLVNCRIKTNRF